MARHGRGPDTRRPIWRSPCCLTTPDGTQEIYDKVRAQLGMDAPVGGILHVAGPAPNGGWRVVEVWETVEAASQFLKERSAPALQAAGFTGEPPRPQFWPVHNYIT